MGDISREPLSTGPSPRGKRRKGPAEVIRLEEVSIEGSSADEVGDESGAPVSRGPVVESGPDETTGPAERPGPEDDGTARRGSGLDGGDPFDGGDAFGGGDASDGGDAGNPEHVEAAAESSATDAQAFAGDPEGAAPPDEVPGAEGPAGDRLGGEPAENPPEGAEGASDTSEGIVVRPRPELAAALEREGVSADENYDRAIPEVDQLVDDESGGQLAEPLLADPAAGEAPWQEQGGEGGAAADSEAAAEPPADPEGAVAAEDPEADAVLDGGERAGSELGAGEGGQVEVEGSAEDPDSRPQEVAFPVAFPVAALPLESAAEAPSVADGVEVPELTEPGALSRVLVAVLLTAREPMKAVRLAEICNSSQKAVEAALERLDEDLKAMGMPIEVVHAGETIRLGTAPEVFPYLARLRKARKAERLSPAALETLAVVAYRQPVIRLEIEAIRGVKVGPMLKSLLDHKLVKVVGRADVPGRPLQYGTTQVFLDRFGLRSLKDLPSVQEFRSLG